jgi:hypothetical protein
MIIKIKISPALKISKDQLNTDIIIHLLYTKIKLEVVMHELWVASHGCFLLNIGDFACVMAVFG